MVYPSLCGPENLPPLEAMALGCPVVASDIEGAREQLGDAALLVRATEPASLADAIERVRTDRDLRARLVEAGLKRSVRYTDREFLEDLARIFDEFRPIRANWP
jgi:glycosyltransferase involved in cell wall biosynthesis